MKVITIELNKLQLMYISKRTQNNNNNNNHSIPIIIIIIMLISDINE